MRVRKNRDIFLLSLHVLARFTQGIQPSPRDVIILRRNADAADADLPVDELCCALISRELGRSEWVEVAA